jgi:hypothetical protein
MIAVIKKAEGPIPELRPPKGQIPFDVPENAIFIGALVLAFTVLVLGRIRQMMLPKPLAPVAPPLTVALRELAEVGEHDVAWKCGQIVRRYLFSAYGIGPEGVTTSELCAQFAAHPLADADSATALAAFLTECDLARFAPLAAAPEEIEAVRRAAELIEQLEARRSRVQPPPLPVVS